jgi:hypothetical protein
MQRKQAVADMQRGGRLETEVEGRLSELAVVRGLFSGLGLRW